MEGLYTLYTHLVVINSAKEFEIAETVKIEIGEDKRLIDLLQLVHNHLESRNDGNKVYKMHNVAVALHGDEIKNFGRYVSTVFENGAEVFVRVFVSVDTSKHVRPVAMNPQPAAVAVAPTGVNKPVAAHVSLDTSNYKTLTKYSYSESGEKYVKVLLDFPDAKNLIKKEDVHVTFGVRSFEILVNNYKGANYKFAVPNLHHRILTKDCSFSFKSNNVQITLRKRKNTDHWWSLHKAKAVGEKAGDTDTDEEEKK